MSESRPKASAIRVLLVDDHATLRQALRSVLEGYANIEVVGEASDGEQALVCVERLQPAVVIMDINLPKMDGITATRLIKVQYPQIAVVGLSLLQKDYMLYSMLRVGASEVVHKENAVATLYGAIQKAVAAVQPVVVMQETPVLQPAPGESEPSERNEPITMAQSPERPEIGEEKDF